jgi:hypothetical protein
MTHVGEIFGIVVLVHLIYSSVSQFIIAAALTTEPLVI